ncbi:MAG: PLP-dependent aminotransferase family protein [Hyphomicrobiales bacterium]|nr:PLP-dependent aminotransferase family protein [Hyphomicrobiales bacterium]
MNHLLPLFRKLPEGSNLSRRDQICELVSAAISARAVSPHVPLPSCRQMADQLGVSRNTVFAAYSRLIDLGLIVARDRSGYYVNRELLALPERPETDQAGDTQVPAPVKLPPSSLIPLDNPLDWRSYPYPFIYNQIDPDLFPVDDWRECARLALGRKNVKLWTGDSVESDSPYLIEQLRQRLLGARGILARSDEILVTLGAQNALSILGTLFASFDEPIAVEDPGFFGAFNAFRMAGNRLVGVPIDREGLIPSAIPAGVKLVFATPSHQFPTMVTMSTARRRELLDAAEEKDFLIIEDDYEAEMNFQARSSPSLRSMDRNQRVIYIGSFSKTLSPGIRIGFMVAHRDIIREARVVRGTMYRHPPSLIQEVVALFIRLGYFDAHLRNLERRYKRRWQAMRQAISTHLDMLNQFDNRGGTSFWLTGPRGFDATLLRTRLRERGVLIDRGQTFHLEQGRRNGLRLGFAFVPVEKMEAGVKIIAQEVNKLI